MINLLLIDAHSLFHSRTSETSTLPVEKSALVRELSTKSALLDNIDQFEDALSLLEAELEKEKEGLER